MDIGIALLMTRHDFNTTDLARKVEEFGFESLWAVSYTHLTLPTICSV